jgi:hypothetical protein
MTAALVDTGAFVALFDDAEQRFEHYRTIVAALVGEGVRLLSTWPCITEASYLLSPRNHWALLEWLGSGTVAVQNFEQDDLTQMQAWMQRYSEQGKSLMDFADASLYWLADRVDSNIVLTVDQSDFSLYRLPDGRHFEIL